MHRNNTVGMIGAVNAQLRTTQARSLDASGHKWAAVRSYEPQRRSRCSSAADKRFISHAPPCRRGSSTTRAPLAALDARGSARANELAKRLDPSPVLDRIALIDVLPTAARSVAAFVLEQPFEAGWLELQRQHFFAFQERFTRSRAAGFADVALARVADLDVRLAACVAEVCG